MRLLDALLGRTRPKAPDLDAMFAVPSAAVTLETTTGLRPSGQAAVAYKPVSGAAFARTGDELGELLQLSGDQSGTTIRRHDDRYGYRWVVVEDPDLEDLVGSVHLVNRSLEDAGYGSQLLCSVFGFSAASGSGGPCHLVYLYKRGAFYPFAPQQGERRDNELELQVRGALDGELPLEPELSRWFPLWGLPLGESDSGS
ncbi:MAG: hypothetical protein KY454_13800 [Actinobacteria bacterium]|nr:hypothetical protein [Actinomycetota bacterium]